MSYFKKMPGKKCYLSPMDINDAEQYTAWVNDMELARFLTFYNKMIGAESEREFLRHLSAEHNYAIVTQKGDRLIGNCGFMNLDNYNRTAEAGIFIGEKESWGKGFGTEALSLLIGYGVDYLNLRTVFLRVNDFNERARRSYEKIGFREIGRRRKCILMEGREYDQIYMDLLAEEFREIRGS